MLYMNHSSGQRQASANSAALKLCFCLFSAVFILVPFLPHLGVKADQSNNLGIIIQDVKVIDTNITNVSRNYNPKIKHLNITYAYDEPNKFRTYCKSITAYAYKLYLPKTAMIESVTANCLGNTIGVENLTDENLYTIRLMALFKNNRVTWSNEKKIDLNSKKMKCKCGAYGSKDEECPTVGKNCTCHNGYDGPYCTECSIGFYRPFGLRKYECLPCDNCRQSHCIWQSASLKPKYLCINSNNYSQPPYSLIGFTTFASNSMHNNGSINNNDSDGDASALSQFALTLLIIIALILLLLIAIVLYRRHTVRARRRERQSLAAQRLFSRFKDDSMLDNDASSVLKIDNQLQQESATLRLGSDSVYQPTTMSVA